MGTSDALPAFSYGHAFKVRRVRRVESEPQLVAVDGILSTPVTRFLGLLPAHLKVIVSNRYIRATNVPSRFALIFILASWLVYSTPRTEAKCYSETPAEFQWTTLCAISEDWIIQGRCCENDVMINYLHVLCFIGLTSPQKRLKVYGDVCLYKDL